MAQAVDVGSHVADFTLADGTGTMVNLAELRASGPVVVFFYPKDETFGCIKEVCAFRDHYEAFVAAGCKVVGISHDSISSHKAFAEHHRLTYPLLSDPDGAVRAAFGVQKTLGLMPGRVTFVIDPKGVVRHRFSGQMNIQGHIQEALTVVRALKQDSFKP